VIYGVVVVGLLGWRLLTRRIALARRHEAPNVLVQAASQLTVTPTLLREPERQQ